MKNPVQDLTEEHDIIKKYLGLLWLFYKIEKVKAKDVKEVLNFFSEFADKCHQGKEEDYLFPLSKKKFSAEYKNLVSELLAEHKKGRKFRKLMLESLKNLDSRRHSFNKNAKNYVFLMKVHIAKEDNVLFPKTNVCLNEEEKKALEKGFANQEKRSFSGTRKSDDFHVVEKKTGKGTYKKYEKLFEKLYKTYSKIE